MFLEQRRFRIRLTLRRMTQWQNHHRNFMHRTFSATHNNPGDDEETQKNEPDEKILPMFLNQMIQELGHTGDINNRVFHTILRGLFDSLQQLGNQSSKFHARRSLRVICTQETHFATSLHDTRVTSTPLCSRLGLASAKSKPGVVVYAVTASPLVCCWPCTRATARLAVRPIWAMTPSFWSSGRSFTRRS